ncbi:MAG TPA: hypothetical protein VMZ27_10410 [Candidatus Saccharimonadales bacterium]|nr:hypothetical protein [Candidatus Saccharimonadales bacterium]
MPSKPLWTDTGISLKISDLLTLHHATGSWQFDSVTPASGPEGSFTPGMEWEEWITNGYQGQLIGFIAAAGFNPNEIPRIMSQNDPGLFEVGTNSVTLNGKEGRLWLGFNDDYHSHAAGDNDGSVVVQVEVGTTNQSSISALVVADTGVQVVVSGLPGQTYILQASSNLTESAWLPISTNTPLSTPFYFLDPEPPGFRSRYYRVWQSH